MAPVTRGCGSKPGGNPGRRDYGIGLLCLVESAENSLWCLNCGQWLVPTADASPWATDSGPQATSTLVLPETLGARKNAAEETSVTCTPMGLRVMESGPTRRTLELSSIMIPGAALGVKGPACMSSEPLLATAMPADGAQQGGCRFEPLPWMVGPEAPSEGKRAPDAVRSLMPSMEFP